MDPDNPQELAGLLGEAASRKQSIRIGCAPITAEVQIDTTRLNRVLQYEPKDLTISVEAGMLFKDLSTLLSANHQMVPLDPPWHDQVTVGGVLAANLSGPRRRLYGTARDLVIGMTFATLEGKLVQTGGMVVKNVAGLDMAKLMIGSYGTLAAIASVNFKLTPIPKDNGTIVHEFATCADAFTLRDRILKSQLQPSAIDILNPAAAKLCGLETWTLLLEAPALPQRFLKEFGGRMVDPSIWQPVCEFTPSFLEAYPSGITARYGVTHSNMKSLVERFDPHVPVIARAGNGVVFAYFNDASRILRDPHPILDHAPVGIERWPSPGPDFAVMQMIKNMMDPDGLLNKGMLHGRI